MNRASERSGRRPQVVNESNSDSDDDFDEKSQKKLKLWREENNDNSTTSSSSPGIASPSTNSTVINNESSATTTATSESPSTSKKVRPFSFLSESAKEKVKLLVESYYTNDNKRRFRCLYDDCDKNYANFSAAKDHVTVSHGFTNPQPFQCSLCPTKCASLTGLKYHEKLSHGTDDDKPWSCDQCHRRFITETALNRHLQSHDPKSLMCDICDALFTHEKSLSGHKRQYHGDHDEKLFQCAFCDKKFISRSNCTNHELVHTNVHEFRCAVCGLMFKHKSNLLRHIKFNHMGSNVIECDTCHVTVAKSSFPQHQRAHRENQNTFCCWCDEYFNDVQYKDHVKSPLCQENRVKRSQSSVEFPSAVPVDPETDPYYNHVHVEYSDPSNENDPQFNYCKGPNGKEKKCKICELIPNAKIIYFRGIKWIIPNGFTCKSTWHLYMILLGEEDQDQERYGGKSKRAVSRRANEHFFATNIDGRLLKAAIDHAKINDKKITLIPLCALDKDPVALAFGEIQLLLDFDMCNTHTGGRNTYLGGAELGEYYESLVEKEPNEFLQKKIRQVQHIISKK